MQILEGKSVCAKCVAIGGGGEKGGEEEKTNFMLTLRKTQ